MSQWFFESSAEIAAPAAAVWAALADGAGWSTFAGGLKARVESGAGATGH